MRVRAFFAAAVASGVVILAGAEIGAQHSASFMVASQSAGRPATTTTGSTPAAGNLPGSAAAKAASARSVSDGSFTGAPQQTPYGTVQVSVTITGGRISDVKALQLTDAGAYSVQVSDYAVPILRSEVRSAQSAQVNSVSGATYTSDGYLSSLQAALDKAHFAG
ncbi:MAG: FMN-binding protein [Lacisediminihabitans sp.]